MRFIHVFRSVRSVFIFLDSSISWYGQTMIFKKIYLPIDKHCIASSFKPYMNSCYECFQAVFLLVPIYVFICLECTLRNKLLGFKAVSWIVFQADCPLLVSFAFLWQIMMTSTFLVLIDYNSRKCLYKCYFSTGGAGLALLLKCGRLL